MGHSFDWNLYLDCGGRLNPGSSPKVTITRFRPLEVNYGMAAYV